MCESQRKKGACQLEKLVTGDGVREVAHFPLDFGFSA